VDQPEVGVVPRELELGLKLGEGGYGVVHLARHRVSGRLFAVKSFTKAKIRRMEERNTYMRLERERKTLKLLAKELLWTQRAGGGGGPSHALARLICSGQDKEWLRLVMPACLGGDLGLLLDRMGKLPDAAVQFYAGCIVLALQQLHTLSIAYRDLKPENVLLYSSGWPVLTDMGLVHFVDDGPAYSIVGTPEFMAPEVVAGSGHGTDVDFWSFGVTLCELLTLATPFAERDAHDENHQQTYANIMQGKYVRHWEHREYRRLHSRTASVVDGLLQVDPATRLGGQRRGVESIRVHPFFWGLSWEALENQTLTPPHRCFCEERRDSVRADFANAACTPLPHAPGHSKRRAKGQVSFDAAASAMDKLFDFSEW